MKCKEIIVLLNEYCENSLDLQKRKGVEHHLAECENCRLRLKKIKGTYQLLAIETIPQPEESFWTNFLPQIRARIERKENRKTLLIPKTRLAFGLLSVLIIAIISLVLFTADQRNIAELQTKESSETTLTSLGSSSTDEQLAEILSSEGKQSLPLYVVLSEDERQNLDLMDMLMGEDDLSQRDLTSILSELKPEELKQVEESVNHLQPSDVL